MMTPLLRTLQPPPPRAARVAAPKQPATLESASLLELSASRRRRVLWDRVFGALPQVAGRRQRRCCYGGVGRT